MSTASFERETAPASDGVFERTLPLALTYPSTLLVIALIVLPVAFEVVLSFSHRDAFTGEQRLVGFDNYTRIFLDGAFWDALWRSALYALTTTGLQMLLGVAMALYTFRQPKLLRNVLRAICFIPYVISIVAAVIVFEFLFDSQAGLMTQALAWAGMAGDWHSGPRLFVLLVVVSVWQFTPFVYLIVLARLETIPAGLFEAAEADGAGRSQTFWRVILPQLRETLIATLLLRLIFMFTKFDTPWLLAGGKGTNRYVETLPVYSFRSAFEQSQLGDAAASGVLLSVLCAGTVMLAYLVTGRRARRT